MNAAYSFGPFLLEPGLRRLSRQGTSLPVTPKAFDTLLLLVERRGTVVSKEDLLRTLWPDVAVEENNLNQQVALLRRLLGCGEAARYIATVPRRGYAFVAPVTVAVQGTEGAATVEVRAQARPRAAWLALAAACLLACAGTFLWRSRPDHPGGLSVAVLPLQVLGDQADTSHLGLGTADALITHLAALPGLEVRPTSAIARLGGADPLAAGRRLGVDAVMEGTLQRGSANTRLTLRLLRVRDGRLLWATAFVEGSGDLFALQEAVAQQVARSLLATVVPAASPPATRHVPGALAHDHFMRGRFFLAKRGLADMETAREWFARAQREDPAYPGAAAGLAHAQLLLGLYGAEPMGQALPKARAAAARALALDPGLAEAHAVMGMAALAGDWNVSGAEAGLRRALALDPGSALARDWLAYALAARGRLPEAVQQLQRACQLDPLSPVFWTDLGEIRAFAGDRAEAEAALRRALELDPSNRVALFLLGATLSDLERRSEADAVGRRLAQAAQGEPWALMGLAVIDTAGGRRDSALRILRDLEGRAGDARVAAYYLAFVNATLGRRDEAFVHLERALAERSFGMLLLDVSSAFRGLRGDPRFDAITARVRGQTG